MAFVGKRTARPGRVVLAANWERVLALQAEPAFGKAADTMAEEARRLVPVDSGDLKASIDSRVTISGADLIAVCYATEDYADFVEYGTGRRGKSTTMRGVGRGGGALRPPADYVHGPSPGQVAQPYLRPAMMAAARQHFRFGRA